MGDGVVRALNLYGDHCPKLTYCITRLLLRQIFPLQGWNYLVRSCSSFLFKAVSNSKHKITKGKTKGRYGTHLCLPDVRQNVAVLRHRSARRNESF